MSFKSIHHQIQVLSGISYILSALDNAYPNSPEITEVYFCLIDNLEKLKEKDKTENLE
jgi:hypothetical protein